MVVVGTADALEIDENDEICGKLVEMLHNMDTCFRRLTIHCVDAMFTFHPSVAF